MNKSTDIIPLSINTEDIITIFAQGMMSPRSQAASYTSKGIDINGKNVHIPNAPDIIYNPFSYDELQDINYDWSINPVHIIFNLIHYAKSYYLNIHNESFYHSNLTELNIAGRDDVIQYQKAIRSCIDMCPTKKIVLFGCSRGASTIISSVGLLHDINEIKKHIGIIILEGPFDSVENVLEQRSYFSGAQLFALENFSKYNKDFPSPLTVAKTDFPLDIPVAFITSKVDTTVPPQCTQNIINALCQREHKHLYHLVLERSPHGMMSLYDVEDRKSYQHFVNSLYNKYL